MHSLNLIMISLIITTNNTTIQLQCTCTYILWVFFGWLIFINFFLLCCHLSVTFTTQSFACDNLDGWNLISPMQWPTNFFNCLHVEPNWKWHHHHWANHTEMLKIIMSSFCNSSNQIYRSCTFDLSLLFHWSETDLPSETDFYQFLSF